MCDTITVELSNADTVIAMLCVTTEEAIYTADSNMCVTIKKKKKKKLPAADRNVP